MHIAHKNSKHFLSLRNESDWELMGSVMNQFLWRCSLVQWGPSNKCSFSNLVCEAIAIQFLKKYTFFFFFEVHMLSWQCWCHHKSKHSPKPFSREYSKMWQKVAKLYNLLSTLLVKSIKSYIFLMRTVDVCTCLSGSSQCPKWGGNITVFIGFLVWFFMSICVH